MTSTRPLGQVLLVLAGLGLTTPNTNANGAGGAGDNAHAGGTGAGIGTLGNGGTGGTAIMAGEAGVDSAGGTVNGGSAGTSTNTATGSVNGNGATGNDAEDVSVSGSLAAGVSIVGGGGGGGAYQDLNSGSAAASGTTVFSSGSFTGGTGGVGLRISGSSLSYGNAGSITGGGGGGGGHNSFYMSSGADSVSSGGTDGGTGGAAVAITGAAISFDNSGQITGGGGGGGGTSYGLANSLGGAGSVVNAGSANGGAGGAGISVSGATAAINNSGSIVGGNGGTGGESSANGTTATRSSVDGGAGGSGVELGGGAATLFNSSSGSITGGNGGGVGTSGATLVTGAGGVGVTISSDGNTLINAGNISGGLPGSNVASARADAVRISGNGNTVQLQAGYSFSGNVVVVSGTGNILSLGGTVDSSFDVSSITSTLPTTVTSSPQYYGFSGYSKVGSSSWTLTGTNTSSAQWDVNGGTLLANGTLTNTSFNVNNGGTLGGTGSIGGVTVNSGGTLSASTLGSGLTINGNLAFASGSTYLLGVNDAGASGHVTVSGDLSIASGSTLKISAMAGSYTAGTQYLIASYSGNLTGSFSTISDDFAYLTPAVSYSAGSVALVLNVKNTFVASGFESMAVTTNQGAAANALDRIYASGGNALTQALLTASTGQARAALAAASGDVVTTVTRSTGTNIRSSQEAIGQRLDAVDARADGTVIDADPWISVSLARQRHARDDSGASGYDNRGTSISFGHDHILSPAWLAGIAFAANSDRSDYRDVSAQGRSDGLQAAMYLRYRPAPEGLVIKAMAGLGWWSNEMDRQLVMGTYSSKVNGRYRMRGASLYGEAGYALSIAGATLEPYAGLSGVLMWRSDYAETTQSGSDGFALAYDSQRTSRVTSVLGTRLRDNASRWQVDVAWRRGLGSQGSVARATFVNGTADGFVVRGNDQGRDECVLGASLNLPVARDAVLYGQFGTALARGYQSYAVQAGLRWWW